MNERILSALEPIVETYHIEAPQENRIEPVCVFYFINEGYKETFDDEDYGEEYRIAFDITSMDDASDLARLVEQALKTEFSFCYRTAKRQTKQDGLFQVKMEFTISII